MEDDYMCSIKERPYYSLMMIMKKRGITQAYLADKTGINAKSLNLKIWGKHAFKFREIQTIANILDISIDSVD